jgi:hypothetical protein
MGAAPGKGTRTIGRFSPSRKSFSLVRRFWPRLMDAKLYFAGSARASWMSSCKVFAGTEGWTRTTDGDDETRPTGAKLLIGSYCSLDKIVDVTARSFVTNSKVCPSAGAAATIAAPRAPLAPLTFST